jgi:mannose-6-phosphate isomerase-like protein (cupin superfamily)
MDGKDTGSPPKSISRETAEHYTWGNGCDGWHLVKSPSLSVIEERMPPGTSEVRHYHQRAQQFFFILSGAASMEIEGETIRLSAGEGVHILPGRRHQIRNDSGDPVRFIVVSQPHSHGDRVVE